MFMGWNLSGEAAFQAEFYHYLREVIGNGYNVNGVVFDRVEFERRVDSGRADIVIASRGKPFIVIETKRESRGRIVREIDPLSPDVIAQAIGYASLLGAQYIVTANPEFVASFILPARGERLDITRHRIRFWTLRGLSRDFVEEFLKTIGEYHLATEKGRARLRTPLDWAFIIRLRSFVTWLHKLIRPALEHRLRVDDGFRRAVERYYEERGVKLSPPQLAKEMSYIFMNKIIFYKILERHYPDLPKLRPLNEYDPVRFVERLQEYFDKAVEVTGDFEAIFKTGIYDYLTLPRESGSLIDVIDGINAFIEDMDYYRLERFEADIIGHVYEDLIEPSERHQLGQFYTPPAIAELITKWCIRSPDDKVLDPAVGSGTFLIKAYSKLKELKFLESPRRSDRVVHKEVLDQLYAIDIDSFPAHLTAMNLAMRDVREPVRELNVVVEDFFKVVPEQVILTQYRVRTPRGEVRREVIIPRVDAVVANPPYTRWVEIPDKTKDAIREALADILRSYNLTARIQQGIEPGIYIHFIMHANKFLKPGGRLGMIISDSWLQTDYGIDFGRYLLENWKVKAIIDISARVFPVPLIGTCIILLEKPYDGEDVDDNEVVFMYLDIPENGSFDVDGILKALEKPSEVGGAYLVRSFRQGDIPRDQKWINLIFSSEEILSKLREKTIPAGELFEISRGNSVWSIWAMKHGRRPDLGAKNFFYFNENKVRQWGLEGYVYPAITSARYVPNFIFSRRDWEELKNRGADCYLFMCHKPRGRLPRRVKEYIEWGENVEVKIKQGQNSGKIVRGFQNISTVKNRKPWYSLGQWKPPIGILPAGFNTSFVAYFNPEGVLADKRLYMLYGKKDFLVYLNSTMLPFMAEIMSRKSLGEGLLDLTVYEYSFIPILSEKFGNLENLLPKREIHDIFTECGIDPESDIPISEQEPNPLPDRKALDDIVFDALGLTEEERKEVYRAVCQLVWERISKARSVRRR